MWTPDLAGRPTGTRLVICAAGAVIATLLLVLAGAELAIGHAGVTLTLLPVALVTACVATWLLESSRRRAW